nr:minor capsid protein [Bacillus pumilus]
MDFLERMKIYIETNVLPGQKIEVGAVKDGNSIAISPTPGIQPNKDLNLGRHYTFPFQILVRHSYSLTGYTTCQRIADHLDTLTNGAVTSSDGSFIFVNCGVYVTPNFVERTAQGDLYTALFQAELYITRSE